MVRFAVIVKVRGERVFYLTDVDGDDREIIPLYRSEEEANEAANRSDLDQWDVISVTLG